MLAWRLDPHCASGSWHDPECHNSGRDLLAGVVSTAPRPHHRDLRLSGYSSQRRHSQVHVQDCRHPQDTGRACHIALLVTPSSLEGSHVLLLTCCLRLLHWWVISLTGCFATCVYTQQGLPCGLLPPKPFQQKVQLHLASCPLSTSPTTLFSSHGTQRSLASCLGLQHAQLSACLCMYIDRHVYAPKTLTAVETRTFPWVSDPTCPFR